MLCAAHSPTHSTMALLRSAHMMCVCVCFCERSAWRARACGRQPTPTEPTRREGARAICFVGSRTFAAFFPIWTPGRPIQFPRRDSSVPIRPSVRPRSAQGSAPSRRLRFPVRSMSRDGDATELTRNLDLSEYRDVRIHNSSALGLHSVSRHTCAVHVGSRTRVAAACQQPGATPAAAHRAASATDEGTPPTPS